MTSSIKRVALALAAALAAALSVAQPVQVQVDGQDVYFPDVGPQVIDGRIMLPARSVFEHMGGKVEWNPSTQTMTVIMKGGDAVMRVGDYTAQVAGKPVHLDAAPILIGNRTLVPGQLFEKALDANVVWDGVAALVSIDTAGSAIIASPPLALRRVALRQWTVVPATLDTSLSSTFSHPGDTFIATVSPGDSPMIPTGTKVEGHVAAVVPMNGFQPGVLDLAFDRLVLPDGTKLTINGSLLSLEPAFATMDSKGMYTAQTNAISTPRMVFVGYGSSMGTLLTAKDDRVLDSAMLKDCLDELRAQITTEDYKAGDVTLASGTQIGVRVDKDLSFE